MTVTEAIRARRSIRRYKDGEISDEHLKLILEAAMCCPSARNMRPYEFKVVKSAEKRRELSALSANFKMLATAACTVIVCGRPDLEEGMGHEFWQQDCSAATENILLQATELGYGSCWCGTYPVPERMAGVKRVLGITDENCVPFSLIALGIADEAPAARGFYDESRVKYY
ncbi:MAG TPA: nitroreductase family protein [Candidatus Coproplasma stercoravium]|nr:nitroreductase family protein [Candidatus Coproplasma stercoravium]